MVTTYLANNPEDFQVITGGRLCTPPIVYIPVCDVPTDVGGSYSTIQVAGDLAAWLASHTEDFSLSAGGTCAPTYIDVCIVPEYTVTQVDQLFVDAYLLAHPGSFVSTINNPCTPPIVYIPPCDVPTEMGGSYGTIQVAEEICSLAGISY